MNAAITAAGIVNEWETQSQADPTGFHVNVLEVGGTSQTANDNGADVSAILADTNELQGDWTNGGRLDLIIDELTTNVDAVETDTQDLQTQVGTAGAGLTAVVWNAAWDAEVQSEVDDALDTTLADSVPADGTRPTLRQAMYMVVQFLHERAVSGTTVTVKKVDGSTGLLTLTLDDGTDPTSITRAT